MSDAFGEGVNDGVSKSIAQLVEKTFLGIMQNSKEGVSFLSARYSVGFEKYIATKLHICSNVKTLISTNHPVSLEKAYEPTNLVGQNNIIVGIDKYISDFGKRSKHSVITATLGAGKSFTMKHIYSTWAKDSSLKKVPIFIELRYINFQEQNIVSYITQQLIPFNHFVTERSVQAALKSGAFALVMDGFDEIATRNRATAEKQILRIAQDYPETFIVLSSRPDINRFLGWNTFSEYSVSPLSIDQVESMIERIDYDVQDKASFLKMIKGGLYKSHEKLLSNPLLASMMLLTFREFQDIPSKMHVFYGTAFDVLFRKHDTTKAEYHREFATGLDLDDFKRIFMTFCFTSYVDKKYSFDESSLRRYSEKAIQYEDSNLKYLDFQHDILKNICIMHQEGETISFIHRSFQEYFTALFLSKRSIPESYEFIDFIVKESSDVNECIQMFIDIDSEEFERKYLIQRLSALDEAIDGAKSIKAMAEILAPYYVVGKIADSDGDGEQEEPYVIVPWARFSKQAPVIECNYKLIQQLTQHYQVDLFNVYIHGDAEWWKTLPKSIIDESRISLLESTKISASLAKKAGIVGYVNNLAKVIKRLIKELNDKHERKRKLLSNSLKK
ncbi:NACHT domain-containing protein [Mesorhizobium sp. BH1-1-4]|uniref:NACHT domain-containing protein n=1 Tax=Mesorhizobium sp. BH1-1-4 TaxID=2876662 RepID=UPI001CD0CFA7|nr:NACHT domain-containing protein [Mesorhizobium sp. BH1-1-4]MBZ9997572.1 NACHT domain-containing protein [Mesorhizobium sp. BH1-1-4]